MPLFTLSSLTCHRFTIASITVSSKGLCDTFCPNHLYAKVGGISVTELNILEREFLSMIDWRLMVSRFLLPPAPYLDNRHFPFGITLLSIQLVLMVILAPLPVHSRNTPGLLCQSCTDTQHRKVHH